LSASSYCAWRRRTPASVGRRAAPGLGVVRRPRWRRGTQRRTRRAQGPTAAGRRRTTAPRPERARRAARRLLAADDPATSTPKGAGYAEIRVPSANRDHSGVRRNRSAATASGRRLTSIVMRAGVVEESDAARRPGPFLQVARSASRIRRRRWRRSASDGAASWRRDPHAAIVERRNSSATAATVGSSAASSRARFAPSDAPPMPTRQERRRCGWSGTGGRRDVGHERREVWPTTPRRRRRGGRTSPHAVPWDAVATQTTPGRAACGGTCARARPPGAGRTDGSNQDPASVTSCRIVTLLPAASARRGQNDEKRCGER
jgi:hypothetical protein